jgi:hypothetical protein
MHQCETSETAEAGPAREVVGDLAQVAAQDFFLDQDARDDAMVAKVMPLAFGDLCKRMWIHAELAAPAHYSVNGWQRTMAARPIQSAAAATTDTEGRCPTQGSIFVDGRRVLVVQDEPMPRATRLWFVCPHCDRRVRFLYCDEAAHEPPLDFSRPTFQAPRLPLGL